MSPKKDTNMAKQTDNVSDSEKLEKKMRKDVGPEVVDALLEMSRDELKAKLSKIAQYQFETEKAMSEDDGLSDAKENVKQMAAPYTDVVKGCKLETKFANILLETKGS